MRWKMVKLQDVCEILGGTTPSTSNQDYWNGNNIWLSPTDLPAVGTISNVRQSAKMITEKAIKDCNLKVLPIGSLVFSSRASIGKIGIVKKPLVTNQGFINLIPSNQINVQYLAYVLKQYIPAIESFGNSTTFKEVSRSSFRNFKIPLPSIEIQEDIAETLDKVSEIKIRDISLLHKYEELAMAIFYDKFGDPVKNEKAWNKATLRQLSINITDGTHFSPPSVDKGIPYITAKHLKKHGLDFFSNPTFVDLKHHQEIYSRCTPKKGDVLYIKDGATTGLAAINEYDFEFSMLSSLALIKPNPKLLNNIYLKYWLNNPKVKEKYLSEFMAGAAIQRFTLTKINQFTVNVPPIEEQIEFAKRMTLIEKACIKTRLILNKTEDLFNVLSSSFFSN
jgi:type I restriction enzyme S subunit